MIEIKQQYVNWKNNEWGYNSMNPEEITVHNTANDASAQNERDYVNNQLNAANSGVATFHYVVDDKGAIQLLPHNVNGWHSGDGDGTGNRKSIGIEICYSKSGGDKYEKAQRNAFILMAQLIKDGVISGTNKIYMHQNRSGKHCPHRIIDAHSDPLGFIRSQVEAELGNVTGGNNGGNTSSKNISYDTAYDVTTTTTGRRVMRVKISGDYINDNNTFGYRTQRITGSDKYNKNDSNHVAYPSHVGDYYGYLEGSTDGIVWVVINQTINGKYYEFHIDMSKAWKRGYRGNSTIITKLDNQSGIN